MSKKFSLPVDSEIMLEGTRSTVTKRSPWKQIFGIREIGILSVILVVSLALDVYVHCYELVDASHLTIDAHSVVQGIYRLAVNLLDDIATAQASTLIKAVSGNVTYLKAAFAVRDN